MKQGAAQVEATSVDVQGRSGIGRWRLLLPLVVVVAGAALRIWHWAVGRPLWLDEQMIALNIRDRSFLGLAGDLDHDQSAPLGWLWTQWTIGQVFGTSERALRLAPLLFGLATLGLAWWVGRRWLGLVGATVLVTLCAVNGSLLRYSDEVKQYSADAFCVLLLLTLAAWAVQRPDVHRLKVWWLTAAVTVWFSMAAVMAAPGIALVLLVAARRRRSAARVVLVLADGVLGVAGRARRPLPAGAALRDRRRNPYATQRPAGLPAQDSSAAGTVSWLVRRPGALAQDPFGVSAVFAVPLWAATAAGVVAAARRQIESGMLLMVPPATAFALAALQVVPLYGRFALWLVPPMCVALAVAAQALAASPARVPALAKAEPAATARWRLPAVAAGLACAATAMVALGPAVSSAARAPSLTGGVDDRAAMSYLRAEHRPGDLVVITPSSWPAVRWYTDPASIAPLRIARFATVGPGCRPNDLRQRTRGFTRVLAWSGARTRIRNMDEMLATGLSGVGRIVHTVRFDGGMGVLYIVDLTTPPQPSPPPPPDGPCVTLVPHRW
jgi:Dolichyl-phosphate-mannose-protein mannosyltransferase